VLQFAAGTRDFSVLQSIQTGSGAHPYFYYEVSTAGTYPGVKWLGCGADHLPMSTTESKNHWHYTSTPPYDFMVHTRATSLSFNYMIMNIIMIRCIAQTFSEE
jgi:hypothetical protein